MGTLHLSDPILRLIPTETAPSSFLAMPNDEQAWRGRYFLMAWWLTHDVTQAWWAALSIDAEQGRATVAGTEDEAIIAGMKSFDLEMKEEVAP